MQAERFGLYGVRVRQPTSKGGVRSARGFKKSGLESAAS